MKESKSEPIKYVLDFDGRCICRMPEAGRLRERLPESNEVPRASRKLDQRGVRTEKRTMTGLCPPPDQFWVLLGKCLRAL